jgi:hypothetical protein
VKCRGFVDKTPLNPQFWLGIERLNPTGKGLHVTEVTGKDQSKDQSKDQNRDQDRNQNPG